MAEVSGNCRHTCKRWY